MQRADMLHPRAVGKQTVVHVTSRLQG